MSQRPFTAEAWGTGQGVGWCMCAPCLRFVLILICIFDGWRLNFMALDELRLTPLRPSYLELGANSSIYCLSSPSPKEKKGGKKEKFTDCFLFALFCLFVFLFFLVLWCLYISFILVFSLWRADSWTTHGGKKKEKRSNSNYNNRLGANLVKYLNIRLPHVSHVHGLKPSKQIRSCLVPFMPLSADWTKFLKW